MNYFRAPRRLGHGRIESRPSRGTESRRNLAQCFSGRLNIRNRAFGAASETESERTQTVAYAVRPRYGEVPGVAGPAWILTRISDFNSISESSDGRRSELLRWVSRGERAWLAENEVYTVTPSYAKWRILVKTPCTRHQPTQRRTNLNRDSWRRTEPPK